MNCWDLNQNSLCDSKEDVNKDGQCDVYDCKGIQGDRGAVGQTGAAGAAGTPGTNGINGTNGTNGINGTNGANGINGTNGVDGFSCWDLNQNQVCDLIEDINTDSVCDVYDCIGTIGPDSITLATQTTGKYVADISAGSNISVSGGGSENATVTVAVVDSPVFSGSVSTPTITTASGNLARSPTGGSVTLGANNLTATSGNIQTSTGNIKTTGGGCFGRTYIASTSSSTGGAPGSRADADALCAAVSANSYVCTYTEMIESVRCGVTMPSAQGWINTPLSTDCTGWSSILVSGASWTTSQTTISTVCTVSQPFLCCK